MSMKRRNRGTSQPFPGALPDSGFPPVDEDLAASPVVEDPAGFWAMNLVNALASPTGDPGQALLDVAAEAMDHVDQTLDAELPPRPIACGPGCVHCCHNQISVTPMEAFALCAFMEETMEPGEVVRLTAAFGEIRARIRSRTRVELYEMRRDLACAFLKNGCCGVYQARPLVCRGWHSLDRASCVAAFESPDTYAAIETYASRREYPEQVQVGLLRGASALGLEVGYLVMSRALALLLERGWREEMALWLSGGKVFSRPGQWQRAVIPRFSPGPDPGPP